MNILKNTNSNLDELVFENRNKAYGAYTLRRDYPSNLKRSFFITFFTPLAIVIFSVVYNHLHGDVLPVSPNEKANIFGDSIIITVVDLPDKKQQEDIEEALKDAVKDGDNGNYEIKKNRDVRNVLQTDTFVRRTVEDPIANTGNAGAIGLPTAGVGSPSGDGNAENQDSEEETFIGDAEQMPEFNGDLYEYLGSEIHYPKVALDNNVQGKVMVSFVIDKEGKVKNAEILRGIGFGCDEEALRVIENMPSWSAGMQNKRKVNVKMIIPIVFNVTE